MPAFAYTNWLAKEIATGNGNRVMTTIMGTIYFSPIIFLEKAAFNLDVPDFKLKGRSAVEDAHLFERIYPAFGLSINEKTFQNIFYGLNWEILPGGSLFAARPGQDRAVLRDVERMCTNGFAWVFY